MLQDIETNENLDSVIETSPILAFGIPIFFGASRLPVPIYTDSKGKELQPEEPNQILRTIINRRVLRRGSVQNEISAVFGEPNFLPFSLLEVGKKQGASVCRIVRKFSEETAEIASKVLLETFLSQGGQHTQSFDGFCSYITEILAPSQSRVQLFDDLKHRKEIGEKKLSAIFSSYQAAYSGLNSLSEDDDLTQANSVLSKTKEDLSDSILDIIVKNEYRIPIATGFLVGRSHVLTNYHIFLELIDKEGSFDRNQSFISEYVAQFGYEKNSMGSRIEPVCYRFKRLFMYDSTLDYALIELEDSPIPKEDTIEDIDGLRINNYKSHRKEYGALAGDRFGYISMYGDNESISPSLTKTIERSEQRREYSRDYFSNLFRKMQKEIFLDGMIQADLLTERDQEKSITDEEFKQLISKAKDKFDSLSVSNVNAIFKLFAFAELDFESFEQIAEYGEPVIIIQHPRGRRKEIVLSDNLVTNLFKDFLWYKADADFSSSGSPVFNQQWQLVAIHNAAVPTVSQKPDAQTQHLKVAAEQGVRVSSIVRNLSEVFDKYLSEGRYLQAQVELDFENNYKYLVSGDLRYAKDFFEEFVFEKDEDSSTHIYSGIS